MTFDEAGLILQNFRKSGMVCIQKNMVLVGSGPARSRFCEKWPANISGDNKFDRIDPENRVGQKKRAKWDQAPL